MLNHFATREITTDVGLMFLYIYINVSGLETKGTIYQYIEQLISEKHISWSQNNKQLQFQNIPDFIYYFFYKLWTVHKSV